MGWEMTGGARQRYNKELDPGFLAKVLFIYLFIKFWGEVLFKLKFSRHPAEGRALAEKGGRTVWQGTAQRTP